MDKIPVDVQTYILPVTQAILGTHVDGRVNFMALGWLSRVNFEPPLLGVCVNKSNQSHAAILAAGEFSVNFPGIDMVEVTDCVGLVSGKTVDKSKVFDVFYGTLKAAPMIAACPLTLECQLYRAVDLPTNHFFIGEIVGVYSEQRFLTDGVPDIEKMRPILLSMPDNRYWTVGACVGKAWNDGKDMAERLKREHQI